MQDLFPLIAIVGAVVAIVAVIYVHHRITESAADELIWPMPVPNAPVVVKKPRKRAVKRVIKRSKRASRK